MFEKIGNAAASFHGHASSIGQIPTIPVEYGMSDEQLVKLGVTLALGFGGGAIIGELYRNRKKK